MMCMNIHDVFFSCFGQCWKLEERYQGLESLLLECDCVSLCQQLRTQQSKTSAETPGKIAQTFITLEYLRLQVNAMCFGSDVLLLLLNSDLSWIVQVCELSEIKTTSLQPKLNYYSILQQNFIYLFSENQRSEHEDEINALSQCCMRMKGHLWQFYFHFSFWKENLKACFFLACWVSALLFSGQICLF